MNTLAIWVGCNKQEEKKNPEDKQGPIACNNIGLQVHINLWKMQMERRSNGFKFNFLKKGGFDHFFDIGLKLQALVGISKLNVYVPFALSADECIDLGGAFHEDTNLVNAIFNENYKVISGTGSKILEVEKYDETDKFNIYRLDVKDNVVLDKQYGGTVIQIDLSKIKQNQNEPYYFRFRIRSGSVQNFTKEYRPRNSLFESAFTNTEIVDFRINEIRSLNRSLVERMDSEGGLPLINKIHFILLRNAKDDYIFSHKPITGCRELEKEIWKTYLGVNNQSYRQDKILAYHWKESSKDSPNSDGSFRSLIKMKFEKNNGLTITIYFLVAMILSVSFNLLASFIYSKFDNSKKTELQINLNKGVVTKDNVTPKTNSTNK